MGTTFANALSGLTANSTAIDIVSTNLANLNTYGYKATNTSFEDLVNETLGGASSVANVGGTAAPVATREFTQGSITTTNGPYDAAIQGSGFFVLQTPAGGQVFTRAGNFKLDSSGDLLTQSGNFVQGWNAVNGALNTNGPVSDIKLPVAGLRPPSATTTFSLSANLDATQTGATPTTFSSPIQVVDSQGTTHALTVTYTQTAAGQWGYTVTIPSADVTSGAGAATTVASGTLSFDSSGKLTAPAASAGSVAVAVTGLTDGAADMNMNWNLYDSSGAPTITQFNQASANLASSQNGFQAGQLTSLGIGQNGQIFAQYSNGDNIAVAQLALGSVLNPGSMQPLGDNTFGVTSDTSVPAIGAPGTGSRGTISGGGLESSTVDIATQFTNLLTYERGYQANSKVITTEDEIIQSTLSLKQ